MEGHEDEVNQLMRTGVGRLLKWTFYHSSLVQFFRSAPPSDRPTKPQHLSIAFLSTVLNNPVSSFTLEPFAGGAAGLTCRVRVVYGADAKPGGPETLVWKSAETGSMQDLKSIAFSPILSREAAVYNHLGQKLGCIPKSYYAFADQEWAEAGFLLEDLGYCSGGKFMPDATVPQLVAAMQACARLYRVSASIRDEFSPEEVAILKGPMAAVYMHKDHWKAMQDQKTQRWQDYARQYVQSEACARLAALTTQKPYFELVMQNVFGDEWNGLAHGDARMDNVFFTPEGEAKLIDFQTVERSGPGRDLAWGLMLEISTDLRRKADKQVVQAYLEEVTKDGVVKITFDELWENTMFSIAFSFIFICLIQNLASIKENMHPMMEATIPRAVKAIEDYDIASFLEKKLPKN